MKGIAVQTSMDHVCKCTFQKINFPTHTSTIKEFFIYFLSGMASLYTLMALSVQRCFYVFNPAFASVNGPDCAWILLGIIWSLAGAIALPPLFGWSEYVPENSGFG